MIFFDLKTKNVDTQNLQDPQVLFNISMQWLDKWLEEYEPPVEIVIENKQENNDIVEKAWQQFTKNSEFWRNLRKPFTDYEKYLKQIDTCIPVNNIKIVEFLVLIAPTTSNVDAIPKAKKILREILGSRLPGCEENIQDKNPRKELFGLFMQWLSSFPTDLPLPSTSSLTKSPEPIKPNTSNGSHNNKKNSWSARQKVLGAVGVFGISGLVAYGLAKAGYLPTRPLCANYQKRLKGVTGWWRNFSQLK